MLLLFVHSLNFSVLLLKFSEFNNNNRTFVDSQVANSPSKLRFEANLSREDSQSTEHSQKLEMISYKEDSPSRKSLLIRFFLLTMNDTVLVQY